MSEPDPIDLGQKDAEARLDYRIRFKNVPPASLDTQTVTVEDAGNGESPPELIVSDSSIIADGAGRRVEVLFWLDGGTRGVRYRGKIVASDDASTDPDRQYVEYFMIEIS